MSRETRTPAPASRTFGGLLDEIAARYGTTQAVVYGDESLTYRELKDQSERLARSLLALGVRRGDRVAALIRNRPEWLIACFGAARIGAVFAPLNTWYQRDEIEWALRHLEAAVLLAETSFLKHDYAADLAEIVPELASAEPGGLRSTTLPALRTVAYLGGRRPGAFTWEELMEVGRNWPQGELERAQDAVSPEDLLFILYTSGSTADPKGVSIRHYGVVENCFNITERRGLVPGDRVWLGSALFYGLGAVNCLPGTVAHGATLVLQGAFDAGEALNVIERQRCTVFYGMSNMIRAIYEHPAYSRRRVESLQKGTAGISTEERRILLVEMGVSGATQSYGLTEAYGNCAGGYPDDPLEVKLATIGKALPGWEFEIVDPETRKPLPTGEAGLLLIRGYTTPGYYRQPAETAAAYTLDGFFVTGDICSIGGDGYLRYHSRLKEMIKTGGINVSPLEVEQLLLRHPAVRQAYVVGVPDPTRGELVVAFVEAAGPLTEEELKNDLRQRVASFKVPARILFRRDTEIPRVASGKVPRFRLREEAMRELGLA